MLRNGKSTENRINDNTQCVRVLVHQSRRLTARILAKELNLKYENVRTFLSKDLSMKIIPENRTAK